MRVLKLLFYSTCITLVILQFITVSPQTVYADTEGFTYYSNSNGILITGYNGDDTDLTIPGEIDGQVVIGISNNAFSSSLTLTSLVIPDSVTYISENAFNNCSNLKNVRFMGNAPALGENAFNNCSSELVIYYDPSKIGFSNPWYGFTTEAYNSEPDITPVPVTGIALDRTSATLIVGEGISLIPTINPDNAADKIINWTSSNPEVVSVDETGTINAIMEGNAIITAATEDGDFTATSNINVINPLTVPGNEYAVPQNYDSIKIFWSETPTDDGYEVSRLDTNSGNYIKVADVKDNEFTDIGLETGTAYQYEVRAYRTFDDRIVYSDYTPAISVKTLNISIGSTLFLYMLDLDNRNSVLSKAIALHYGITTNNCALFVSESFRRLGLNIPTSTARTNQVESQLSGRGWVREMDLTLLQPGDICFTTDKYGNKLGGHSTHVFIFMGWANKEKTLMNICDNQTGGYGTVLHIRTIFNSPITDATAFFYHTDITDVSSILKAPQAVQANPIAYNKVKITWQTSPGAYGYIVYRSTSKSGTYSSIATTRNTNYTNSYITTGKTYYYKVRAYDNIATSKIYGSYSAITAATPVLTAPSVYVYSNAGSKVKLSWKAISGASGYIIYRSTSKNGVYSRVIGTSSTSYTKSGLNKGKLYYYKVRAYKYVGKTTVYSNYSYINFKAV